MSRIGRVLSWAEPRGRARGLDGPSSVWLAIWVLAVGYRMIRRIAAPKPVVVREALAPGEQLVVTHFSPGEAPRASRGRRRR